MEPMWYTYTVAQIGSMNLQLLKESLLGSNLAFVL